MRRNRRCWQTWTMALVKNKKGWKKPASMYEYIFEENQ